MKPTEPSPAPAVRPVLRRNKTTSALIDKFTTHKQSLPTGTETQEPATLRLDSVVSSRDWEKVLEEAQSRLDEGKREICRGLCWEIVQDDSARPKTKIHAYNILSTLTSSGNAWVHLDKAENLTKSFVMDEKEKAKLLKAIGELRETFQ